MLQKVRLVGALGLFLLVIPIAVHVFRANAQKEYIAMFALATTAGALALIGLELINRADQLRKSGVWRPLELSIPILFGSALLVYGIIPTMGFAYAQAAALPPFTTTVVSMPSIIFKMARLFESFTRPDTALMLGIVTFTLFDWLICYCIAAYVVSLRLRLRPSA